MKFGETLYQRSVPKWAAYNLNYNELKHLIKLRTTNGAPSAVPIPGQSDHRWSILEDELFGILKEQYDNIGLFLRSKYGEIERRLAHLDKSVRSATRSSKLYSGRTSLQARKYQRLLQEAETIEEDIQALTRFAAVQKTAFRKILKKYHKWTNSDALRIHLEVEVFSDGQLDLNVADQMQHVSLQTATIKELEEILLGTDRRGRQSSQAHPNLESPIAQINKAAQRGALNFDAALASVPFGEAAGTATYWIHLDNLEEAKVLLLRYTRDLSLAESSSRQTSSNSVDSEVPTPASTNSNDKTSRAFFDNAQRFLQDSSSHSPCKVAMCARWSQGKEALVTMSDMSPRSDFTSTVCLKRKDLKVALDRGASTPRDKADGATNVRAVKEFLSQHRDVKPLAELHSSRSRYAGLMNSSEVGTWSTLDTNIYFSPYSEQDTIEPTYTNPSKNSFPHAVLEIRWEFGRKPEVIRAFDSTHLAERVNEFTLESAAIHSQNPLLTKPSWTILLEKDIRKVPVAYRLSRRNELSLSAASCPSSTADSVFSDPLIHSNTGSETSPMASVRDVSTMPEPPKPVKPRKKARILAESPDRKSARYYSEYDDPESELNQQGTYTIYVDPDAEAPGMATLKYIGASVSGVFSRVWPSSGKSHERTPLLVNQSQSQDEGEQSSESDSELTARAKPKYKGLQGHMRPAERYRLRLSRRQRAFERTLMQFSAGLVVLSYIFLLMSGILLTTGRKKEVLEVDAGATTGVIVAFLCMVSSIALVYMRKEKLTRLEWLSLTLADGVTVLLGAGLIVGIVQRATHAKH